MEQQAPGRAQLERDVAEVVGTGYERQAKVWQAIGMLKELYGLEERAALAYLCQRATMRSLGLAELAAKMVSRQDLP